MIRPLGGHVLVDETNTIVDLGDWSDPLFKLGQTVVFHTRDAVVFATRKGTFSVIHGDNIVALVNE